MKIEKASYMIQPNAADRVRLDKAVADMGGDAGKVAAALVHRFFCRRGIKNPVNPDRSKTK